MRRFIQNILFAIGKIPTSERQATILRGEIQKVLTNLQERKEALSALISRQKGELSDEEERVNRAIEDADALVRRLNEELDIARSRARVNEASVNVLTSHARKHQELWDAETAIEVRRRVGAIPSQPLEE